MSRLVAVATAMALVVGMNSCGVSKTGTIPLYDALGVKYEINDKEVHDANALGFYKKTGDGKVDVIKLLSKYRDEEIKAHVMLHELIHWTMISKRTDRYSKKLTTFEEEYVAERGALVLAKKLGMPARTVGSSAHYLRNHSAKHKVTTERVLELDRLADEAVEYILNKLR